MGIDIQNSVIEDIKTEFGIAELGFLNFTHDLRETLSAKFADIDLSSYPDYLQNTVELRSDPLKFHKWSKSAIIATIPFSNIPDAPPFLQKAEDPEFAGKVASYAMKQDYHIYGKQLLAKFAESLQQKLNCEFRKEMSVDTAPVAERTLAAMAGVGKIGSNSCILVKNHGSGCFIGEIFTDIQFSDLLYQENDKTTTTSCRNCGQCIKKCPTEALSESKPFNYQKCRSNLTIEKRGILTSEEENLIGDWIFGCDICTSCCPETDLHPPFEVDLEWLLLCPSSELKKAIKGTTLEYPGVTNLRRNAIIVLKNRNTEKTTKLLKQFSEQTGSDFLKKM